MSFRRCLFALPLLALAASAPAVEFDEKVRAPQVRSGAELKPRLESYAALMKALNERSPLEVVKDASLVKERFDVRWQLGRLVDSRQQLPELESLGFTARPDGSYVIDTAVHPEWRPLDQTLITLADPSTLALIEKQLAARGMSPAQIDIIRQYAAVNNLKNARDESKLRIALAASKVAKKLQKIKRLDDTFMWSFAYQKSLDHAEVDQRWAANLLKALEPQSQRILSSYMQEGDGQWFIVPTSDDQALQLERELLVRPDFEQLAKKAFKEGNL